MSAALPSSLIPVDAPSAEAAAPAQSPPATVPSPPTASAPADSDVLAGVGAPLQSPSAAAPSSDVASASGVTGAPGVVGVALTPAPSSAALAVSPPSVPAGAATVATIESAPSSSLSVVPAARVSSGSIVSGQTAEAELLGVRVWASEPDRMRSDLCALANKVSDRVRAPSLASSFSPCPHGLLFEATLKLLKKSTVDPSCLEPLAFMVPGLSAIVSASGSTAALAAQLSTVQAQLKAATKSRLDVVNQLKLVRRRNDALQDRVNELEQARPASSASKSSPSASGPSSVAPMSKVEELKARVSKVEHERDEALRQVRTLEAAHAREAKQAQGELSDYKDLGTVADLQTAMLELRAYRASGSPAEVEDRERRLKNLAIFALRVAIVYDRSLSEFESIAGRVLLGYDRRGRLLESLFHLIAGDAPGIADRLPGVITAVVPDLAAEDERRPDTGRALSALVTALESSQDPEEGQVSSQRSSLFGLHNLPTADEVRALLQDRPSRLQVDFSAVPFFDDPDTEAAFAGLVRGGSFSADVIAGLRGRLSSADQTSLDAIVVAESAHAPLPDSSTASGSSVVDASRQAADALPKSPSPTSQTDHLPAGVDSPTHSPDSSPRVGSKNRPLRVASSPDDDESEADEEEDRQDDSGGETESRLNDDVEDEEDARSGGSDVSADDDDEAVRFPNAVPSLGPVTKLLRSDLSTVRASRASFAKSRGDFNSFVQRAIAYRAESDIDGMWPEEPSSYMERSRVLNFPREVSWMLGLFDGEISTPTTQEYPELVRAAGSHPVDARDLGVYYKTRPWAALQSPPTPVSFKPDDPRFARVYSNLKLMYERHAQVLWERTHYFLPLPDTDERRVFLHLRRKRNSSFTPIWNGYLEAVVELIRDGVSLDVLLDPVFYWPPAHGVIVVLPRKQETINEAVLRVDRLEPERTFFVGEFASEHPVHRIRAARRLPFKLAPSVRPSPPATPPKSKGKSSAKSAAKSASAKSSSAGTVASASVSRSSTSARHPASSPSGEWSLSLLAWVAALIQFPSASVT
ncbi:hypothetical protein PINS_up003488 [Pythium insidiosum]|nr:hypothetical protein PINS_up003488 [Pythium insidiosum]